MKSDVGSITRWIWEMQDGHESALQPLMDRYFAKLVRRARAKLCAIRRPLTDIDEEDVVVSAFQAFCNGLRRGRYPRLEDRHDLWRLLLRIVSDKSVDQHRRNLRLKRGGGRVVIDADLAPTADSDRRILLDQVVGREPSPEFAAMVAEEYEKRLASLEDPKLRLVAELKFACFTIAEIAERLGCSRRLVDLRLQAIREAWAPAPTQNGVDCGVERSSSD